MNNITRTAAFFGLLAVALGAFGAHFLRETLVMKDASSIWQTAVFYQFMHSLALLWLGSQEERTTLPGRIIAICWIAGIFIFSGSLYLLAITGHKWLGALTPCGGMGFLLGWALLLFAKFRL